MSVEYLHPHPYRQGYHDAIASLVAALEAENGQSNTLELGEFRHALQLWMNGEGLSHKLPPPNPAEFMHFNPKGPSIGTDQRAISTEQQA